MDSNPKASAKELIVFTHNDLDMAGCVMNIEFKFPETKKKYFFTNYQNIDEQVDAIIQHANTRPGLITHVIVADVSFSDNKPALRALYANFTVIHIDHHMYPAGFWDEFPNMRVVWDDEKSASLLCNEFFGNAGQNQNLDNLTKIIDIYDVWQDHHPFFGLAQDLNDYFWRVGAEKFLTSVLSEERMFKLPLDFKEVVEGIHKENDEAIRRIESEGLIQRSGELTIIYTAEKFNRVMLREMHVFEQTFVVGISNFGIVRIRVNRAAQIPPGILDSIRERLTGNINHGHAHAFTYKSSEETPDGILREAQKVATVISEEMEGL